MGISLLSGTAIEERIWWVVITKEYSSETINNYAFNQRYVSR